MRCLTEIRVAPESLDRYRPVVGEERVGEARRALRDAAERMGGRVWWHVNSTARGGGVAEMLPSLIAYGRGAGLDARWLVIAGSSPFFSVTKRLHHALHGSPGDGSPLDAAERATYEAALRPNAQELLALAQPGDVVLLHDPQTAGLAPALARHGAVVLWRCHIGADEPNAETARGWAFLAPYLNDVAVSIFSRAAYVPAGVDLGRVEIVPPSLDPFSAKNQALDAAAARAILVRAGIVAGPAGAGAPAFRRADGSPGRVERRADVVRHGPAPAWETPLVVQVSRWDPLKDPIGVLRGFAGLVDGGGAPGGARLVLAGPDVKAVDDDPEGGAAYAATVEAWRALPDDARERIHLASLPMADEDENAAIVNALQRHAAVVVQKSLHEGFGLTVTEAMWKGRPVVASAVGGIRDQIVDGEQGMLVAPTDLDAFGAALRRVLTDPELARCLGRNARERARHRYLGLRHLVQYAGVLLEIAAERSPAAAAATRLRAAPAGGEVAAP